jgi:hypothetical protein
MKVQFLRDYELRDSRYEQGDIAELPEEQARVLEARHVVVVLPEAPTNTAMADESKSRVRAS